jgi:hypothetical protein
MKFNPDQLTGALRTQQKFAADIREIHDALQKELKRLNSDETKKQYNGEWIFDRKLEATNKAQLAALKIREEATKELGPVVAFARELDIDRLMVNARFVATPEFQKPQTEVPLLAIERAVLEFIQALGPSIAELGDNAARTRCAEQLAHVDGETFAQIVKDAAAAGDVARLAVAERVLSTRTFVNETTRSKAKSAFVSAKASVQVPGRDETLDVVEKIHNAHANIVSTQRAIVTNEQDRRAVLDRVNDRIAAAK